MSVIDPATNTIIGSPIPVGTSPVGVAVNPGGDVYVANYNSNTVSVIDPATNTVIGSPIPVGTGPYGVAVNPGGDVYVTNGQQRTVSVIDPATNTVIGSPITAASIRTGWRSTPAATSTSPTWAATRCR